MFDNRKLQLLFRKGGNTFISQELIKRLFKLSKSEASAMLDKLEECGYIEGIGISNCWGLSMKGKIIAHQTFERLYTIQILKKHLNSFNERVLLVNTSLEYPHFISKVKITSEYPIQNIGIGIRIIYSLDKKKISEKEFDILSYKLRSKSNRVFHNIVDNLYYPERAIYEFLKSKSHVLKLKAVHADEMEGIKGSLIFDVKK